MFDYSSRNCFHGVLIFTNENELRSRLGAANLSHLMKITIESPETLSDEELEQIVDFGIESQEELLFNTFCFISLCAVDLIPF